jgi:hypothetical protein
MSSQALTLRIDYWPIERLVAYPRNPRKNDAAVDRMCASIREFSFAIPVLAKCSGEVIDGYLRLKAARKMGSWPGGDTTGIPVIPYDGWTDTQVRTFRLLVNRSVSWADWDETALALELQEIQEAGFEDDELARLLAAQDAIDGLTDEDAVARLMTSEAADLVFVDPPYNVDYEGYIEDHLTIKGDRMSNAEFKRFVAAAFHSCRTVMKSGASIYVCHSSS